MKYEDFEVGESYEIGYHTEKVIAKSDEHEAVLTIDGGGTIWGWSEDELELFKPIKKELPERGLLVHGSGDTIVYRNGEKSGFGFNVFGFCEDKDILSFSRKPEHWRAATPEDEAKFIKMLKAEADKRGLGVDAKIKGHADGDNESINENYYMPNFTTTEAWNNHGQIFYNGIWAEPLTMLDEVCDTIKKHLPNIVIEQVDGVVTLKKL